MEEALNKANLYVKQEKGAQLLKWKGMIDAENFAPAVIVYKDAGGKEYPTYCANPNRPGVEEIMLDTDPHVWGVITNGYPYKTPQELGLNDEYSAYYATKMAIWAVVHNNYSNLSDWTANGDQNKSVETAMKSLVAKGLANQYVYATWMSLTPKTMKAGNDEIDENALSQKFEVKSNVKIGGYKVVLNGDVPEGRKVTDMQNNIKETFSESDTTFKVVIPKTGTMREGNFGVVAKAELENKAILFGLSHDAGKQDYYASPTPTRHGEQGAKVSYKEVPGTDPVEPPENPDIPQVSKGLQILKVKKGTTQGLVGAVFKITDPTGGVIGHFVTDNGGQIAIPDMPVGPYYIEETVPPAGYVLDVNNHKDIIVKADEPTIVTFSNEETASLEITKIDEDTGVELSGATFRIALDGGHDSFDVYTNSSGKAIISSLKSGTYTITEIAAPEGYILNKTPQTIKLEPGKKATITMTNKAKPGLVIKKYDEDTSLPLPGAEFSVAKKGGSIVYEGVTDFSGTIKLEGLEEGWYTITEIAAPKGYLIVTESKDVFLEANKQVEIKFDNRLRPSLQIMKIDSQSGNPLAEAVFKVVKTEDKTESEYVTDATGTIVIHDLDEAVYTVTEIKAPDGYLLEEQHKDIALEWGKTKILVFENKAKPALEILKVDEATKEPLARAKFRVTETEGNTTSEYVTDENGRILIENLEAKIYTVEEIVAPDGYLLEEQHKDIELEWGKTKTIVFTNKKRPVLEIKKIDFRTKEPLAGAKFKVTKTEDKTVSEYLTDETGVITINKLDAATYTVEEITAPDGYLLDIQHKEITLEWGKTKTLIYEDIRKPTLIINKINGLNFKPIPNTTYKIEYEAQNGGFVSHGTFRTDKNGQIILPKVDPGWYVITEKLPAPGYRPAANPVTRKYLTPGENAYTVEDETGNLPTPPDNGATEPGDGTNGPDNGVQPPDNQQPPFDLKITSGNDYILGEDIINYPLNSLVLKKVDANTLKMLHGAVFEVRKVTEDISGNSGTVIGRYTTDNSGIVVITGLESGAYVVEEVKPPAKYLLSENSRQQAWMKEDGTSIVEITFSNYPYGSILVTKVDAQTGKPLPNARFKVTDGSHAAVGNTNGEYITNENGEFLVPDIKPDSYVVTEIEAPEHYVLDTTPQTVQVGTDGKVYKVSFKNQPSGSLILLKKDDNTKEPLADAEFKVTTSKGNVVGTGNGIYRTDKDGSITIPNLPKDTYIVEEVKAPMGYLLENQSKTIAIDYGKTNTLTFYNKPLSCLIIKKVDSSTKQPLTGAVFQISQKNGGVVGEYTTNGSGIIQLDELTPGWYTAVEVTAPSGYLLNEAVKDFEVTHTKTVTLAFENDPKASLIIQKMDSKTKEPLSGARFKISKKSGDIVGEYTTNSDGLIQKDELVPGWYTAVEVTAPSGYLLNEVAQDFEITHTKTVTLTFTNEMLTSLIIKKTDDKTGEPLGGAKFSVEQQDGRHVGDFSTSKDGTINIPTLVPGWYIVRELQAPDSYLLDESPKTVEVKTNAPTVVTFTNKPMSGLQIKKINSVTRQPIEGVEFSISQMNGEKLGNFKTGKDGLIFIPNLKPGWYSVYEVREAEGYIIDSEPRNVEVKWDKNTILEVENKPEASLLIVKTDMQTNEPLEGVKFDVAKANGERIGTFTTDRKGRILINELTEGQYTVTESEALRGYELEQKVYEVEVKDGQEAVLKVKNKPLSGLRILKVDAITGEPIYNVEFMIFDHNNKVVGTFYTDNKGVVDFSAVLTEGRYSIRETRAAEGYYLDEVPKHVEFVAGKITEIVWKNHPCMGQIQITKVSGDDNEVNGLPAGTPLEGAIFEVYSYKAGNLVDRFVSAQNGKGVSKPLPLGRYIIKEVQAPQYYQTNNKDLDIEIEFATQIIKLDYTNNSANTGVSIKKTGNVEAMPGDLIRYDIKTVKNTSTVALTDFFWRDVLPVDAVRLNKIVTGTYNQSLKYKIIATTNKGNQKIIADNLSTTQNNVIDCSNASLGLYTDEFATSITFFFGNAKAGFTSVEQPQIFVNVLKNLPSSYQFANKADIGGKFGNEWVIGNSTWLTTIYRSTNEKLPKTGY